MFCSYCAAYLHCLDCCRQTGKVKGEYNFSYLKRQDCHKLKKNKKKKKKKKKKKRRRRRRRRTVKLRRAGF
eukprot:30139-Amphidinium_carterae.1